MYHIVHTLLRQWFFIKNPKKIPGFCMKKNGMQKSGEKPSIMVSHRFFHLGAFGKMEHFQRDEFIVSP
ncbi:hypothetical protein B4096_1504 [Heyndrickxia coagulans]|nr:hypothetical protein B4096_1504 [Heyndrickxia coagulans]